MKKVLLSFLFLLPLIFGGHVYCQGDGSWYFDLQVTQGSLTDILCGFGVDSSATDGYDPWYDLPAPPTGVGDYVRMVSYHPEWNSPAGDAFSQDIAFPIEYNSEKNWLFTLEATDPGTVIISLMNCENSLPDGFSCDIIYEQDTVSTFETDTIEIDYVVPIDIEFIVRNSLSFPSTFSLLTPINNDTSYTLETLLKWESSTGMVGDSIRYEVWLDTLSGLSDKWLVASEIEDTTYSISGLSDDREYYWTIKAINRFSQEIWADDTLMFYTYFPDSPSTFNLLEPQNNSIVSNDSVQLLWQSSTDLDPGDELTYEIQWATTPVFNDFGSATTADTFFTFDELADDQTYFWRVKVTDYYDLSTWSIVGETGWSFNVDRSDQPLPFNLISPLDMDTCWTLDTTLTWQSTIDPDLFDTPFYDVWLDTFENLSTRWIVADSIADTTFIQNDLFDDHVYFWTVRATDSNTEGTWSNDTLSFSTYLPEPPNPFELLNGELSMNDLGDSIIVTLSWNRAIDPDPGSLEYYKVLLDTTEDMNIPFVLADSVEAFGGDTLFTWTKTYGDLPMLGESFWTVYTYDNNTEGTWADEPLPIFMTSVDDNSWGNVPVEYEFVAAYPNPFNPSLTVVVSLPTPSDLTVHVFNVMGQQIATIADGQYQEGFHSFIFDGQGMASGVYFVIANVPGKLNQVKKVVLMK